MSNEINENSSKSPIASCLDSHKTYSDEQLLELIKLDNVKAFTELYNRYWKLLFALVADRLQNLHNAEEIVQDVFADFWNRRTVIKITTSVQSFLSASVRYQSWKLMARQRKESQYKQAALNGLQSEQSLLTELEAKFLFDQLQQRITNLPQKCRLVYEMSKVQGLSNKEIASKLQITEKAVERNTTRALRHLRSGTEVVIITWISLL